MNHKKHFHEIIPKTDQKSTILTIKLKRDLPSSSKMEQLTLVNGKEASDMARAFKNGQMGPAMMATGSIIRPMVQVSLFILVGMSTLETSDIITLTGMENIYMLTVLFMTANGKIISNLDLELNLGMIIQNLKVSTLMDLNMVLVSIHGLMGQFTRGIGTIINFLVLDLTIGSMADPLEVNGQTTVCMVSVYINGKMAESILDNIKKIKSMAMEFISGRMVECLKVCGNADISTAQATTETLQVKQ